MVKNEGFNRKSWKEKGIEKGIILLAGANIDFYINLGVRSSSILIIRDELMFVYSFT